MTNVLKTSLFVAVALLTSANAATAASILGNWSGSSRTWNSSDFTTIASTLTSAGHTVEANEAISAANLANNTLFLIGEPLAAPTVSEIASLQAWVSNGGTLLLLADSGGSAVSALNAIAAGIGSSLTWGGSASSNTALAGGVFATDGPPYDIVGEVLTVSPGTAVAGATALSGDYLRYEAIGHGFVFGFADRIDHNFSNSTSANVNGQLFLNLADRSSVTPVPEPATALLTVLGLAALARGRRRSAAQ